MSHKICTVLAMRIHYFLRRDHIGTNKIVKIKVGSLVFEKTTLQGNLIAESEQEK